MKCAVAKEAICRAFSAAACHPAVVRAAGPSERSASVVRLGTLYHQQE